MAKIIKTDDTFTVDAGAVGLGKVGSDPTNISDTGFIYTKSATDIDLFYINSNGDVIQITSGTSMVASIPTKIEDGTSKAEITGTNGAFRVTTAGTQRLDISSSGLFDLDAGEVDIYSGSDISIQAYTGAAYSGITLTDNEVTVYGVGAAAILESSGSSIQFKTNSAQRLQVDSSGNYDVNSGLFDLDATDDITITSESVVVLEGAVSGVIFNTGASVQRLEVDGSGNYDVDAASFDLDATGIINLSTSYDDAIIKDSIYFQTTAASNGGGNIHLDSENNIFVDALGQINMSTSYDDAGTTDSIVIETTSSTNGGNILIDSDGDAIFRTGGSNTVQGVAGLALNGGTGVTVNTSLFYTQRLEIDSSGNYDLDAAAFDLDATGAITLTSSNAGLSAIVIETSGSGSMQITSGGSLASTSTGTHTISAGTTLSFNTNSGLRETIDSSGDFSLFPTDYTATCTGPYLVTTNYDSGTSPYSLTLQTTAGTVGGNILLDSAADITNIVNSEFKVYTDTGIATQRVNINTAGTFDFDSVIFDLDASGQISLTSSYDNVTTTDSIVLETTSSASGGGDITVSAANHFFVNVTGGTSADETTLINDTCTTGRGMVLQASKSAILRSTTSTAKVEAYDGNVTLLAGTTGDGSVNIDAKGTGVVDIGSETSISIDAETTMTLQADTGITIEGETGAAACPITITSRGTGNITIDSDNTLYAISDGSFYLQTGTGSTNRMVVNNSGSFDIDAYNYVVNATSDVTIQADDDITIVTSGTTGIINIDSNDYLYLQSTDNMYMYTGGTARQQITSAGDVIFYSATKISTGGETSPDVDDGGLCLDQNGYSNKILTFKSSLVAHPFTSLAEADTYGYMQKRQGSYGGLEIVGYGETSTDMGLHLIGAEPTPNTYSNINATGVITLSSADSSGTGYAYVASTANLYALRNISTTRLIVKGDGRVYNDYSTTMTTYDVEDDLSLLRAAQQKIGGVQVAEQEALSRLVELGIINEDGFGCQQELTRLQLGATHQLFKALKYMSSKLGITEEQLKEVMIGE